MGFDDQTSDKVIAKLREMHPDAPEDYVADALRLLNLTEYLNIPNLRRFLVFRDLHDAFSALLEQEIKGSASNSTCHADCDCWKHSMYVPKELE